MDNSEAAPIALTVRTVSIPSELHKSIAAQYVRDAGLYSQDNRVRNGILSGQVAA